MKRTSWRNMQDVSTTGLGKKRDISPSSSAHHSPLLDIGLSNRVVCNRNNHHIPGTMWQRLQYSRHLPSHPLALALMKNMCTLSPFFFHRRNYTHEAMRAYFIWLGSLRVVNFARKLDRKSNTIGAVYKWILFISYAANMPGKSVWRMPVHKFCDFCVIFQNFYLFLTALV
jgi:hypothetical protein